MDSFSQSENADFIGFSGWKKDYITAEKLLFFIALLRRSIKKDGKPELRFAAIFIYSYQE